MDDELLQVTIRMIHPRLCVILASSLLLLRAACAEVVVWDKSSRDVVRFALLIEESEFNLSNLTAISRRILSENRGSKIIHVRVFTDQNQVNEVSGESDLSFPGWLNIRQRLQKLRWRVGELIAFGGNGVLRLRDGQTISRSIIAGETDPLLWKIDDVEFELLHIAFPFSTEIAVFARSSRRPPDESLRKFFVALKQQLHPNVKTLSVQENSWFTYEEEFPIYYWFDNSPAPTEEQHSKNWAVRCYEDRSIPKCH